jgi:hypothetical protein
VFRRACLSTAASINADPELNVLLGFLYLDAVLYVSSLCCVLWSVTTVFPSITLAPQESGPLSPHPHL